MSTDTARRGRLVTAIASSSLGETPASVIAFSIIGFTVSRWLREAISGTTPP